MPEKDHSNITLAEALQWARENTAHNDVCKRLRSRAVVRKLLQRIEELENAKTQQLPPSEERTKVKEVFLNCAIMYELRRYGATWENLLKLYKQEAELTNNREVLAFCNSLQSCLSPDLALDRSIQVFFKEL